MAIELIDKIKQKNNGTFKLVDAIDVELSDGKDVETAILELYQGAGGGGGGGTGGGPDEVYQGSVPPQETFYKLWVDTSSQNVNDNSDNTILNELIAIISSMNNRIISLETDVAMLKEIIANGGYEPPPTTSSDMILTFEDGSLLTFEDGSVLIFESVDLSSDEVLTFEDGSLLTFEDGSILTFNSSNILLSFEDNSILTFEDNSLMTFDKI